VSKAAKPYEEVPCMGLSPAPGQFISLEDLDGEVVITARIRARTGKTRAQALYLTPELAAALTELLRTRARTGYDEVVHQEVARLKAELELVK